MSKSSFKFTLIVVAVILATSSIIIALDVYGINSVVKDAFAQIQAGQSDIALSNLIK